MLAKHIGELLEIVYMDQSGKLSQRRIEIKRIRNGLVYADCLRSGEPRTFREENILAWQPSKAIRPTISVKQLAAASATPVAARSSSSVTASPSTFTATLQSFTSNAAHQHQSATASRHSSSSSKSYRKHNSYTSQKSRTQVVSHIS
ncbi:hypothetical protein [Paenibacillus bovis]|uniref:WYL domain-containing protein n=1 Tax=Paenibacillus bovis TaxID=1616788 RepID=A0A172ZJ32_9BACL|nr:hypothetical protein [Paenibacillus bovis]ANF97656.1 hypothetical protein AR543_17670 [Paenibacillus bovis]